MNSSKRLFFIALLPPQEIQDSVTEIKQYFADRYASRHALKSPPHITLQPPFEWFREDLPKLEEFLAEFSRRRPSFSVTLSGFSAFPPRVIYVNVLKTAELLAIQKDLMQQLEANFTIVDPASKGRPFSPHMTVAFRDLTKQNFKAAWSEFESRSLSFDFTATQLTLLIHQDGRWHIQREFDFAKNL